MNEDKKCHDRPRTRGARRDVGADATQMMWTGKREELNHPVSF